MERLSKQQKLVLRFVCDQNPVTVKDITERLGLARSSAHYTTKRLIERGFIETGLRPANGRDAVWQPAPSARWMVNFWGVGL